MGSASGIPRPSLSPIQMMKQLLFQLIVPTCMREEILKDLHEGALGGHLGGDKTFGCMKERFYRPGYHNDVRE
jgi:hypothetical protein